MDSKKLVIMVVLVVVIVIAVVLAVKRTSNEEPAVLATGQNEKVQMIDMKSLEVFTETSSDWAGKYKADSSGHFKNPKTGDYTIVRAMKCSSCGQLIPVPEVPASLLPPLPAKATVRGQPTPEQREYSQAQGQAMLKVLHDYKCPRCGKEAWNPTTPPPESK
ncbi:MAG: hypothetical protein ABSA67_14070 [Candidatus Brocadiia bacterium]|jgi:predicted RNA-binding Zn-ribbon protein involved in translation (DUF1610 family)